ncbi:YyaR [Paenibacillus mucilaginosus 3016]|uniref:YyaR n=1 Tax=Paenibacillus mucilaginosus 3016 TaxID=1116391 RepID=H6NAP3_9BACL|nr:GNAT family N-acetyltransferase [Paenibacillus mucilaginosus]AFC30519.1 YyaR [Paenibacillus mucilaginosus 3016]WFA19145.1 GNAT family N-acetyltransferase [Paenibacillus mucilaginosus]
MIIKMTHSTLKDFNKHNEGFMVTGRIIPKYEDSIWTYTEEIFEEPYYKQYENDDIDISYIYEREKAVFLYYDDNISIGQIKLRSNWNGFALVEDIAVAKDQRKKGIGTALLKKAEEWARQNNLIGLMLETQDVNISACLFYARNDFKIGGVDSMLYSNFPTANEKAIFWYFQF